ncbi:hypothetical protein C1O66_02320 [Paucibacter aquatile]|uniref:Peptidase S9 prolyl oligopeptidase catalytic domain-containing protein n=2 Tax=Kinneretia aquatilis TaxID=2070761 RepID=A0A2N8L3G6_9BURK|nr:hypothetical protein C1O66_02320 [Paucibacter aquatile]
MSLSLSVSLSLSMRLRVLPALALLLFAYDAGASVGLAAADREALQGAAAESAKQAPAELPGRAAFLGTRGWEQVSLSPDGKWLGVSHRLESDIALSIEALDAGSATSTRGVLLKNLNGARWQWAADGAGLWLSSPTQISWVSLSGQVRTVYALKKELRSRVLSVDPVQQAMLIDERLQPAHNSAHRLLRVYSDGRVETLLQREEAIRNAVFDGQGVLRGLRLRNAQYRDALWHNAAPRGETPRWQLAWACPPLDACSLTAADEQGVWFESPKLTDRTSLLRWQAKASSLSLVSEDPQRISDLKEALLDGRGGPPLAVAWYTDRQRWQALDPAFAPVLKQLETRFPFQDLYLSIDRTRSRLLVLETHARLQWPRAHVMDLRSAALRPVLEDLRAQTKPVSESALAAARFFSWQASDGMRLHGQLYLPPGKRARELPLVALIHGGPFSQTRSEYHRWTQLMVSRGAAVFTPNFRASEGYGQQYLLAHKGDFGKGAVLRDVLEGMDALLAQGIGDPDRQALVGHSFGGYGALMGVTHHPGRFRFALALAAPSDFGWAMKWYVDNESDPLRGDSLPMAQRAPYLGVPIGDETFMRRMREQSAATNARQLRVPVYLWAGAQDDRVPLKSIAHYAATLKSLGKPVSLWVDDKASHNPTEPVQWEALFYLSERALHAHFGGPAPQPPSAVLATYLQKAQRIGGLP